ncbi:MULTISPECIES: thioredoxin family protein [unclassified Leptolyngbya]|uniref:thioredoxin family protein n=1 Tax=unclassified Leptolyngbya TaxID=2650499 RepID=UPI0016847CAA|nr:MULTISPECIES: thioredoxin family protein [unclassified Leptolyngbya]MBD1910027.1 thioredoxin family protein [Leptolyngbya sp. FACHB-8]MBD2156849.1 thioredoxin family protein [Leptolyngbya sp. FACHB-16]
MPKTASTMLALGTIAPNFQLPDVVSGKEISLTDFSDRKALLVIFASPHCPFVKHIQQGLAKLGQDYAKQSLGIVAISSNDPTHYPDDAPDKVKAFAEAASFNFPFVFDETQEIAKAYNAACTPDFFLFDGDRKLVYRGQFDDSRPSNEVSVTGQDLRNAIDAILADQAVLSEQKPSIGCNIKWKVGNEPSYYNSEAIPVGTAS